MARLLRTTARAAGPEIDNVIERDAGLRSVRDAAQILDLDAASVVDLLEQDAFPNAYRTTDGQWRLPLEDLLEHKSQHAETPSRDVRRTAAVVRRRRPHDTSVPQPQRWMTPSERRSHIITVLSDHPFVRVSTLSADLGVSQMTVRRDLAYLEAEGQLARTYASAMVARRHVSLVRRDDRHEPRVDPEG